MKEEEKKNNKKQQQLFCWQFNPRLFFSRILGAASISPFVFFVDIFNTSVAILEKESAQLGSQWQWGCALYSSHQGNS